ncbi:hypothetical protein FKM82_015381 [Ascaphus truei]
MRINNLAAIMDEQQALNSIMQDLAVLHKASRPALSPQETGKSKSTSPKKQVKHENGHASVTQGPE